MARLDLLETVKQTYRNNGYSEERDFPGEYYFMFNPRTLEKVRLYYNGRVLEEGSLPSELSSRKDVSQ